MRNKTKKYCLSRLLSMVLALCMVLAALPAQAFAVSEDDDPTTWPAPDEQYTAPGKSPVYIYQDYTDDPKGFMVLHRCENTAALISESVKATGTKDGVIRYVCDTCGSWAEIVVPALTNDAFTLDPASRYVTDPGVVYNGGLYSIVFNVAPAFQRFLGKKN